MLNKKVLVKSITKLSEARYCAGMFVDYISFDLNSDSEYFLPKKKLEEIRGWLSGIAILGSFDTNDSNAINQLIDEFELDGFIFSQDQYSLLSLVSANVKVLEWEATDLSFLPHDLDPEITLLIVSKNEIDEEFSDKIQNTILLGYDFEGVKTGHDRIDGFAFMSSFETQVGLNPSGELMEAFEYIEENY